MDDAPNIGDGRRILVTSQVAQRDPRSLEPFRRVGFELVERYDLNGADDTDTLRAALDGIWGSLAGTERYSREVITGSPDLRVIARCGVGYDTVDVAAASDAGVAVLTTPGANVDPVADFTLALILANLQHVRPVPSDNGVSNRSDDEWVRPLAKSTVGIVGLGAIGRAVAQRLRGFDCRLLGVDPMPDRQKCRRLGIELTSLEEALPRLDVLTLHVPLNSETRGMIGATELGLLPPGSIVINTSRGGVVDEGALLHELTRGRLGGAGLDVFDEEPLPAQHPFLSCGRVILGGHAASFTQAGVAATLDSALGGLQAVARGEVPGTCVNFEARDEINPRP